MESGKELVRQYIRSYEAGSPDSVKAFLHHSHRYYPPGGGKPMGLEERMRDEAFFFSAFTDIEATIDDQVEENSKVASRITMKCTHTGDYQGIPATNRRIAITYMDFALIQDGLIIEEWAEFDLLGIFNQLK